MLPAAAGPRPRSQFFTLRTDHKPANNMSIFFPAVNWFYRSQNGFVCTTLSLNRLVWRLLTIWKKSLPRVIQILDKDMLKRYFSIYFTFVAFISPGKFSKIVFLVWNFVGSAKFCYKNNFCLVLLLKPLEIRLDSPGCVENHFIRAKEHFLMCLYIAS